jgi:hypothetical protein
VYVKVMVESWVEVEVDMIKCLPVVKIVLPPLLCVSRLAVFELD